MTNYEDITKDFHCIAPDINGELPVRLPSGERCVININTSDIFGLEILEATGLLERFKEQWSKHENDFIMSGVSGKTRYIWHCCKSENDSGVVTFFMPKNKKDVASFMMNELAQKIEAKTITNYPRETGES